MALAPQPRVITGGYPSHSVMEDVSDTESDPDLEAELDPDQQRFYEQQQKQAMIYQQHTSVHGSSEHVHQIHQNIVKSDDDEDMYSDDDSSASSIPEEIDFSLTYALRTFVASVEGQASVVKGDTLLLLDDANSYWWLVRVLKTEDVGYIPAENIETPYERLARLNKHRNVDLATATVQERQAGEVQGREKLKGVIGSRAKGLRAERSGEEVSAKKGVKFGAPTFVEHPGVTWSEDEDDESDGEYVDEDEDEGDIEEVERGSLEGEYESDNNRHDVDVIGVEDALGEMEPDDGIEWADGAGNQEQSRIVEQKQRNQQQQQHQQVNKAPYDQSGYGGLQSPGSSIISSPGSAILDPAQANGTRRITATPNVANGQPSGPLLPSAIQANAMNQARNISNQSMASVSSIVSAGSQSSISSPPEGGNKMKKGKKPSKEDLQDGSGEKRKSKSILGGLFSKNKKDKKGISSSDPRASEDSIDVSPTALARESPEQTLQQRAPTPGAANGGQRGIPQVSVHGASLARKDQALQQAYTSKYLNKSSSGDIGPDAVTQSSMRLAATINEPRSGRPSSIILSPNPAGPPLLNVIRVFAGEHIKSEASFKTVLLNETTSSTDLIRQLVQRFRLHHGAGPISDNGYYLTVKDVSGEEMELTPNEKPLAAFQESVEKWASVEPNRPITPTVKRSSISSISSVASLSNHPAIEKLGMNDFSDDSTVKIYFNRRTPGHGPGMPEPNSEFSSYSTHLSTVQESSSDSKIANWASSPEQSQNSSTTTTPPTPQQRYNPSLTVNTGGAASPERFSSPSAKFTIQLVIHPTDLPDGLAFDPSSEAIIPRQLARERQFNGQLSMEWRKRLFILPRNVTVVEAIEQGLDRFGIQDGVVDGGDDVEDKGNNRRQPRTKYHLTSIAEGNERQLFPSSKIIDAYTTPPQYRPAERTTAEQRRRSRDHTLSAGQQSDILPTDPVFVLRRVAQKASARQPASPHTPLTADVTKMEGKSTLSPQEIIAAQRAATRANQRALISAHSNTNQGVDVVLPERGTFRSSRLLEVGGGEVVRYSFIDDNGETYDISEIIQEELGKDSPTVTQGPSPPPPLMRSGTGSSNYVTAPSTPLEAPEEDQRSSADILRGVVQRAQGQPEGKLEEKLQRVINKVKSWRPTSQSSSANSHANEQRSTTPTNAASNGRTTPSGPSGRMTPTHRSVTPDVRGDLTPKANTSRSSAQEGPYRSDSRASSRQADYQNTAMSVNRIINRHHQRQQPSIASIMSDLSGSPPNTATISRETSLDPIRSDSEAESYSSQNDQSSHQQYAQQPHHYQQYHPQQHEEEDLREPPELRTDGTRSSTPLTATSSTHPTPPFSTIGVFTRSLSASSHTPRSPVTYNDDFGIKALMAIIDIRSRAEKKPQKKKGGDDEEEVDEVERMFYGDKVTFDDVHPEIGSCFKGVADRMDQFDREIDEVLALVAGPASR